MPRKKKNITLKERLRLIKNAKINVNDEKIFDFEVSVNLEERIKIIQNISAEKQKNKLKMLFFVMYDIRNNKVRREISKYLERNGCMRVQKSIFFASADREKYKKLHTDLKEVQESYENNDSIFFVPVSTDEVKSMKVLGRNVDFEIVTGRINTLFF